MGARYGDGQPRNVLPEPEAHPQVWFLAHLPRACKLHRIVFESFLCSLHKAYRFLTTLAVIDHGYADW